MCFSQEIVKYTRREVSILVAKTSLKDFFFFKRSHHRYPEVSGTFSVDSPIFRTQFPSHLFLGLIRTSTSVLGGKTVNRSPTFGSGLFHFPPTGSISTLRNSAAQARISVEANCRAGQRCGATPHAKNEFDGRDEDNAIPSFLAKRRGLKVAGSGPQSSAS